MPADPRGDDSEAEMTLDEARNEVTPVGRVSKNLLELSSAPDQNQNTRAYQAPAELLELARRQRERAKAKPAEVKSPSLAPEHEAAPPRPIAESKPPRERPTRRPGRSEESVESSAPAISVAPASSSDSVHYIDDGEAVDSSVDEAAPPVARSRPARALSDPPGVESAPGPPASLRQLMQVGLDPGTPRSSAAARDDSASSSVASSARISTTSQPRTYYWALVVFLFIALGFALAKWRALDLLLPR